MSVRSRHVEYEAMSSRWEMCRDASEGEHAVHQARTRYLPKLKNETDDAYKLRLAMTPFFGATYRTIAGLRGMIFRKPPVVDVSAVVEEMSQDIDLAGTSLLNMAQAAVEGVLTVGRAGLLVDYPMAPPGITNADAQALNLRPLISMFRAESIYNWSTTRRNGVTTLSMVRLTEEADLDSADEFERKCEKRYRVLDLINGVYRQRVYRVNEKDEEVQVGVDIFPTMNNATLDYIPFVFLGASGTSPRVGAPPLIDLVTTNFHHYMQATSYERGCFFSGLPTMFISGLEDNEKEISIGGPTANALSNPDAKAYYVEVASQFEALRRNLEDKKQEMAVLGARMLEAPKAGVEAAETIARRQSGEMALLSDISQTIGAGIGRALQWFSDWAGAAGEVKFGLNRDFLPAGISAQDVTALVSAWQAGAFSAETLFDNLVAGEIISDGVSFEEEQARVGNAGPRLANGSDLSV